MTAGAIRNIRRIEHQPLFAVERDLNSNQNNDNTGFTYDIGYIKTKKDKSNRKFDDRDKLSFVITLNEDESNAAALGTYLLEPTTSCGDLLDLGGKIFIVRRVSFLYRHEAGGLKVFKKKLNVVPAKAPWQDDARSVNTYLQ